MTSVVTNHHMRELSTWLELEPDARDRFDYLDVDEQIDARFVWAYGSWHDVRDTQRIIVAPEFESFGFGVQPGDPLAKWHSIATDAFYSGVVFRYPVERDIDIYEYIIVGRFVA